MDANLQAWSSPQIDNPDQQFISILACPSCKGNLAQDLNGNLVCLRCDQRYPQVEGIWRFLLPSQSARYQPFLDNYRVIRQGDGWERQEDNYYLNLPNVPPDDPQAPIWKIRQRTFGILRDYLTHPAASWALDLGAGNCWLSHHLALMGYRVLALDINVEGRDGLCGGALYLSQGDCFFQRGQASIDCLPISNEQITLCIINGAVHYVNLQATLENVFMALKPRGQLIIMDSPVFDDRLSGMQMRQEQLAYFDVQYSVTGASTEGPGFLVLDEVLSTLKAVGFSTQVRWPDRPGARKFRKIANRLSKHRQTACFPIFINTKL